MIALVDRAVFLTTEEMVEVRLLKRAQRAKATLPREELLQPALVGEEVGVY